MSDHLVAAVDIAVARSSTLVLLRGLRAEEWFATRSVDEATEWLVAREPDVIAIDAPCSTSHGLLDKDKGLVGSYAGRVCDFELMRRGIPLYQVPQVRAAVKPWMELGYQLYDALRAQGYPLSQSTSVPGSAIEIYPYADFATLVGGRPLKKSTVEGIAQRIAALKEQGLQWDGRHDHDSLDALVGALTGLRYLEGRATPVGDPGEALLWLPVASLMASYSCPVGLVKGGTSAIVRVAPASPPPSGVRQSRAAKPSLGHTTQPGYRNLNGQVVVRCTDRPGTDRGQRIYVLRCQSCENEYGANGSDIWQRKCPRCQRGRPGLEYG